MIDTTKNLRYPPYLITFQFINMVVDEVRATSIGKQKKGKLRA